MGAHQEAPWRTNWARGGHAGRVRGGLGFDSEALYQLVESGHDASHGVISGDVPALLPTNW